MVLAKDCYAHPSVGATKGVLMVTSMRLECACNCDTMYVLFIVIPFKAISFGTHIKVACTGAPVGNMYIMMEFIWDHFIILLLSIWVFESKIIEVAIYSGL